MNESSVAGFYTKPAHHCFGCAKKRSCKVMGTYKYDGKNHNIYVCQWCRAVSTKRKQRGLPC